MWKEKNSFLWQGKALKLVELIGRAISWMKEFKHWHGKKKLKMQLSIGGVGVVIRNDRGDFVAALAKRHDAIPSPLLAEIMATRDVAWLVKEKQLQALVFKGECVTCDGSSSIG
ncbi:hypothetical protein D8674_028492 [Pyrus ussuriensis x Pyrus communis]|uniref:RNase H type-1 domain-containing protein n=1 Tax=Pyrus ussuriensis x Pyrus communis TaxID=2448454 RepID=A0A5N5HWE0_9ROSA|nr:hypothetical protein D8674_028492 [Pyrus ussuriensis x Pyrus communis]